MSEPMIWLLVRGVWETLAMTFVSGFFGFVLGLPVGGIRQYGPAASAVILPTLTSDDVKFGELSGALGAGLQLRLFGKPEIDGSRRLGVALATGETADDAIARAKASAAAVSVKG